MRPEGPEKTLCLVVPFRGHERRTSSAEKRPVGRGLVNKGRCLEHPLMPVLLPAMADAGLCKETVDGAREVHRLPKHASLAIAAHRAAIPRTAKCAGDDGNRRQAESSVHSCGVQLHDGKIHTRQFDLGF